MITPEQMKKLFEIAKPEGFRIKYDNVSKKDVLWFDGYCVMFIGDDTPRIGLYYLFLQKCIEGIYKWQEILIEQNSINITVHHSYLSDEGIELKKVFGYTKGIDQAKEQA